MTKLNGIFLESIMLKMGFCRGWTNLIMNCVCTVEFGVLINWKPGNHFFPSRGIHQGDLLSPYLFLMVSDVFSRLIQRVVDQGEINGIQMNRHGPSISHLFLRMILSFFFKLRGRAVKIY